MDNSGRQVAAAAAVGLFRKELSNCNLIPCLISIDFATDGLLGLETQDDRINEIPSMRSDINARVSVFNTNVNQR